MKVAVCSTNPVKIEATRQAFAKVWPKEKWEIISVEVESGVSNQPMSDKESIKQAAYGLTRVGQLSSTKKAF